MNESKEDSEATSNSYPLQFLQRYSRGGTA